jgi:COMPASS component SWD2
MELSKALNSLKAAKIFQYDAISNIDFDDQGGNILLCTNDKLQIYDSKNCKVVNTINSKKYGCALARFTHRSNNILFASTVGEDIIRYMSTYDNKFLMYFKGHKSKVCFNDYKQTISKIG